MNRKEAREKLQDLFNRFDLDFSNFALSEIKRIIQDLESYEEVDLKNVNSLIQVMLEAVNSDPNDYLDYELIDLYDKVVNLSGDNYLELAGGEIRIIEEDEIEEIYKEEIEELIKDCYLGNSDLPHWILDNIDFEAIADYLSDIDGYGSHFSSYDGEEHTESCYYIFRVN